LSRNPVIPHIRSSPPRCRSPDLVSGVRLRASRQGATFATHVTAHYTGGVGWTRHTAPRGGGPKPARPFPNRGGGGGGRRPSRPRKNRDAVRRPSRPRRLRPGRHVSFSTS